MRVNVYSQELTNDHVLVQKKGPGGRLFSAVRMLFHSSTLLHQPPLHQGEDDDRSGVTIWLPRSNQRREQLAQLFERMAHAVREAPSEDTVESQARTLAEDQYNRLYLVGIDKTPAERTAWVEEKWQEFVEQIEAD